METPNQLVFERNRSIEDIQDIQDNHYNQTNNVHLESNIALVCLSLGQIILTNASCISMDRE